MEAQNTTNTENNLKKEEQNWRKPIMPFKEIEKSILQFTQNLNGPGTAKTTVEKKNKPRESYFMILKPTAELITDVKTEIQTNGI